MNGDVYITLSTPKIVYKMHFDRNISIIRGDSGTGKSLLCELISLALAGDETVTLSTNGPKCIVMPLNTSDPTSKSWKDIISDSTDSVIFVDEMCDCFHANEFYTSIQYTSNYFVLLTRRDYSNISYSPKAIFEFKKEMGELQPVVRNTCLYPVINENVTPSKILTEDRAAGYHFYQLLYPIEVTSAGTKTKVDKCLRRLHKEGASNVVAVVDGAAFGSEFDKCVKVLRLNQTFHLYFPESFEWLLLHSTIFHSNKEIQSILSDYLNTIDWSKFLSCERYFTNILKEATKQLKLLPYDKSSASIDPVFTTEENLEAIRRIIPFF